MPLSARVLSYSARSIKKLLVTRIMITLPMATLVHLIIRTEAVQAKCRSIERMKSQASSCSAMVSRQTDPQFFAYCFGDGVLRGTCDVMTI